MKNPVLKLYNIIRDQYDLFSTRCSWRSINPTSSSSSSSSSSVSDCNNVSTTINDLPDHILEIIFQNLFIGDRFRGRLVSKSWNRILSRGGIPWTVEEAPWEIVSNDSYTNRDPTFITQIRFRSLSEDRFYSFKPPNEDPRRGVCCCGSSRGWMLMSVAGESKFNPDHMFLWDPLSGSTRRLPPLPINVLEGGADINCMSCLIDRVQVLPASDDLLTVAVIRKQCPTINKIALCMTGDEAWTRYEEDEFFYCDIMFHERRSALYVIAFQTLTAGGKLVPERDMVDLPSCRVGMRFIRLGENAGGRRQSVSVERGFRIVERQHQVYRLVRDERNHHVLVAMVNLDQVVCGIEVKDLGKVFECHQMRSVTIKSAKEDGDDLEDLPSIGNLSVLLGGGSDSMVVKGHFKGVDYTDCVYFAIDDADGSYRATRGGLFANVGFSISRRGRCSVEEDFHEFEMGSVE